MKKLISGLCAGGLAATFALTSIPSIAAPAFVPPTASIRSDVVQIQDVRKWRKNKFKYNGSNQGNNWNGNNFRKSGNSAYYNGHQGYPYQRRGYRQHNGFWFPAAAFIAGAVIGGAIINNTMAAVARMSSGVMTATVHTALTTTRFSRTTAGVGSAIRHLADS
jgi:hypothetical protein